MKHQNGMIISGLQNKVSNLIENSSVISKFHEHESKVKRRENDSHSDSMSSMGSISSANERDMDLLFTGEHTY